MRLFSVIFLVASHRHQGRLIMYQKRPGVFMADWWDADGRRHRKQFSTSAAAREHEQRDGDKGHADTDQNVGFGNGRFLKRLA